jgi:hypothetical protein
VASIPGYLLDEFTVPTSDGGTLTFHDVWVFVLDVSSEFDGIWGMNMFNPAAQILYDPFDPDGTPSLQISFFQDRIEQPLPPLEDPEQQALLSLPFAGAIGLAGTPSLPGFQVEAAAAPQVTGVQFGYGTNGWIDAAALAGRTAPWTITKIAITFDQDVLVDLNDLQVSGTLGGLYAFSAFSYNAATRTAVWTLATPIQADRLTITLDGDDASADGNDGVSAGGAYLSGDVATSLDVLYGDVDGNGSVNLIDALLQRGRNGTSDPWADINGDGTVNLIDALLLRGRNGTRLP